MDTGTHVTIIMSLLGFLQTIFIFILAYLFKMNGTMFAKLDTNKADCIDKIAENARQDKIDKANLEDKMVTLLDKHYVTSGQLTTLEQTLLGKVNEMVYSMDTLTSLIKTKL